MMKRIASLALLIIGIEGFVTSPLPSNSNDLLTASSTLSARSGSSTALNVWWFGGTEQSEVNGSDDSCELVAVRIERTSPNSRRIAGDIVVPTRLEEVWSILTDYDRLSIHVPNLMESKIKQINSRGEPGDGQFRCRLYQVGAQKIIGFDFSASVTMDMTERIIAGSQSSSNGGILSDERTIGFKCVDSQFFSEFDGDWKVKEQIGPDGGIETLVSYVVDVRPKGPVPVAALEWRIREDVPTNLRAVKAATIGMQQKSAAANSKISETTRRNDERSVRPVRDVGSIRANTSRSRRNGKTQQYAPIPVPVMADWDRDETMAKYL